jgi:hypothetical protein
VSEIGVTKADLLDPVIAYCCLLTDGLSLAPMQTSDNIVKDFIVYISRENLMNLANKFYKAPITIDHEGTECVGRIVEVFLNDKGFEYLDQNGQKQFQVPDYYPWAKFLVDNSEKAINIINNGLYNNVSTGYRVVDRTQAGGALNSIPYDFEVLDIDPLHVALVARGRYDASKVIITNSLNNGMKIFKLFSKKEEEPVAENCNVVKSDGYSYNNEVYSEELINELLAKYLKGEIEQQASIATADSMIEDRTEEAMEGKEDLEEVLENGVMTEGSTEGAIKEEEVVSNQEDSNAISIDEDMLQIDGEDVPVALLVALHRRQKAEQEKASQPSIVKNHANIKDVATNVKGIAEKSYSVPSKEHDSLILNTTKKYEQGKILLSNKK